MIRFGEGVRALEDLGRISDSFRERLPNTLTSIGGFGPDRRRMISAETTFRDYVLRFHESAHKGDPSGKEGLEAVHSILETLGPDWSPDARHPLRSKFMLSSEDNYKWAYSFRTKAEGAFTDSWKRSCVSSLPSLRPVSGRVGRDGLRLEGQVVRLSLQVRFPTRRAQRRFSG